MNSRKRMKSLFKRMSRLYKRNNSRIKRFARPVTKTIKERVRRRSYIIKTNFSKWLHFRNYFQHQYSSRGNDVVLYNNGSEAYQAMWDAMREAKYRIWMETYILKLDDIGKRTIQELIDAAKRGVKVALIYDHLGSLTTSIFYGELLKSPNAIALPFNEVHKMFRNKLGILNRNHQKLLLIDNLYAFCGGMNISAEYCGTDIGGLGRFRDTHSRVQGPIVYHLSEVFMDTVRKMDLEYSFQKKILDNLRAINNSIPQALVRNDPDSVFIQALTTDKRNKKNIQNMISKTINLAQKHVYLTSPYFLPPASISKSIIKAARRGVDVRILTCGKSDIPLMNTASSHIYGLFLRNKVRVYELCDQELHAKTITVDGKMSMVGSYNLDHLSYKHLLDVNLNFINSKVSTNLEEHFFEDLKRSNEVRSETWEQRTFIGKIWAWIVYQGFKLILK